MGKILTRRVLGCGGILSTCVSCILCSRCFSVPRMSSLDLSPCEECSCQVYLGDGNSRNTSRGNIALCISDAMCTSDMPTKNMKMNKMPVLSAVFYLANALRLLDYYFLYPEKST